MFTTVTKVDFISLSSSPITLRLLHRLDPARLLHATPETYGTHLWPSALILASYIFHHRAAFRGTRIFEIGSGAGLPGLLCAALGSDKVVLSDDERFGVIETLAEGVEKYNNRFARDRVQVVGFRWDRFASHSRPVTLHADLPQEILRALENTEKSAQSDPVTTLPVLGPEDLLDLFGNGNPIDYILGSDVFFLKSDFEPIIATIAMLLQRSSSAHTSQSQKNSDPPPPPAFLTTYHQRNSAWRIDHLLDRWGLHARLVPLSSFGFMQTESGVILSTPRNIRVREVVLKEGVEENEKLGGLEMLADAYGSSDEDEDDEEEEQNGAEGKVWDVDSFQNMDSVFIIVIMLKIDSIISS
ncbi:hypothetical protein BJ742DRAFT_100936 [Cladochytrium replicatum]|nr:hypothetical protein BJ742DRAFT_100936 [Cladochytrium replicatum]